MNEDNQQPKSDDQTAATKTAPADPDAGKQPAQQPAETLDAAAKNSKSPLVWVIVALVVVAAGGLGWWYHSKYAKPAVVVRTVKVGVFEPTADVVAELGQAAQEGVALAQKQFSAPGLTMDMLTYNAGCDSKQAIAGVKSLAAQGAVAIIGDYCSNTMQDVAPTANRLHVVMVSPAATSPDLSKSGPYIFRDLPDDAYSTVFTADRMRKDGVRKLAIIYTNELYGQGLSSGVAARFKADGGTVVTSQSVDVNSTTDVSAQMAAIKAANPDGLYIATNEIDALTVAILQKQHELLPTVPAFGPESFTDPALIQSAGALADGLTTIAVNGGSTAYTEMFEAAYHKAPDLYSAQVYDAYQAIFKALATGVTTGPAVRDALTKVDFQGVSGHIKFNQNRDVQADYSVYKVVNGQFVQQN